MNALTLHSSTLIVIIKLSETLHSFFQHQFKTFVIWICANVMSLAHNQSSTMKKNEETKYELLKIEPYSYRSSIYLIQPYKLHISLTSNINKG